MKANEGLSEMTGETHSLPRVSMGPGGKGVQRRSQGWHSPQPQPHQREKVRGSWPVSVRSSKNDQKGMQNNSRETQKLNKYKWIQNNYKEKSNGSQMKQHLY